MTDLRPIKATNKKIGRCMGKVFFGGFQLPFLFYFSLFMVASRADCWDWEEVEYEGAPKVEICLDGECIETMSSWSCGNTTWTGHGYKNGISVSCDSRVKDGLCITSIGEVALSKNLRNKYLRCTNLDDKNGCGSLAFPVE